MKLIARCSFKYLFTIPPRFCLLLLSRQRPTLITYIRHSTITMDKSLKRSLTDRIYEKRKAAALELERIVTECLSNGDHDKINLIIKQLRNEFAYNIHEPQARYGGLIGLAAISIALGPKDLPKYLNTIIHPVIACFGDNDPNVRYYACEALYNIAKVAKGEILLYFNEIFDILCKLVADVENSVKNAADILDRLIKDIVCDKATNYISVLNLNKLKIKDSTIMDKNGNTLQYYDVQSTKAFSLPKFIPLLKERIYATNTYTRLFIVSWLILLDSIPDLELISYLPSFLDPLLSYLKSPLKDVRIITENFLKLLLQEIRKVNEIKLVVEEKKKEKERSMHEKMERRKLLKSKSMPVSDGSKPQLENQTNADNGQLGVVKSMNDLTSSGDSVEGVRNSANQNTDDEDSNNMDIGDENDKEDIYIPGQDTVIDYPKIIDILVNNLESNEDLIKTIALDWLINILVIAPYSFILLLPKLVVILLSIISNDNSNLRETALKLNDDLMELVSTNQYETNYTLLINNLSMELLAGNKRKGNFSKHKNESHGHLKGKLNSNSNLKIMNRLKSHNTDMVDEDEDDGDSIDFDDSDITSLNKLISLDWLIMLQQKDAVKFMGFTDKIFIILLKTLNCSNEKIINKVLDLLSRISNQSDDKYFNSFMVDLLVLFKKDSKLLDSKSDFIIKKICKSLDPERVYKSLSHVLFDNFTNNEEDLNFISMMIQILNNNLIIAPELKNLRKKLIEKQDSEELFQNLFKCWSLNSPSLICLTLLTSNYELSYKIINQMVKYEININILVQLDLLIQLLESPIFAKLRLDLLDPVGNIYLFKCLYGLLMLLPQSHSFKILQNRLSSISSIINLPMNNVQQDAVSDVDAMNDELLNYFNDCQQKLEHLKLSEIEKETPTDKSTSLRGKPETTKESTNADITANSNSVRNFYIPKKHIIGEKYNNIFNHDEPLETSSLHNQPNF